MRPKCKRVAVIGGGFSGISVVKAMKEEDITPVCFEKSDQIGGVWRYRDEVTEGLPSLMWSTTINHSKELGTFSDFPMPKESPNYLKHSELYRIFLMFVEKFDLSKYIICNREVIHVKKSNDYNDTGRWLVTVKNTKNSETHTESFDGVMVCCGMFSYPKMAEYPDMNIFQGKILHTHSLKRVDKYYNKNVVVIGTGASAIDAAVEVSSVAKQVYLSVRTPSWIVSRIGPYGMPFDYSFQRRFLLIFINLLPTKFTCDLIQHYLSVHFNYAVYGTPPKYPIIGRDPIFNDILPTKLMSGSILMRPDIKYFTEDGVIFNNEDEVTTVDTVIMGTGYDTKFPFLERDTIKRNDTGKINLYKCIYPIQFMHPTLAIIGYFLPWGAMFPLMEIQARWAAHMLSHGYSLPTENIMKNDVEKRYEANRKRYCPSPNMTVRVDVIQYLDEIASEFGVKPNFWKMAFTDPKLFLACTLGASVPFQYRLVGPHMWKGAREAILESPDRMRYPLSKEKIKNDKQSLISKTFAVIFLVALFLIICETALRYYALGLLLLYYFLITRNFATNYLYPLQVAFSNYYGQIFGFTIFIIFILIPFLSLLMIIREIFFCFAYNVFVLN